MTTRPLSQKTPRTTSDTTRTDSPPLTSNVPPADTDTLSELTDSDSPDTASSTLDDDTEQSHCSRLPEVEHNLVPTNEQTAASLHTQPNRAHALGTERHVQTVHRVRTSAKRRDHTLSRTTTTTTTKTSPDPSERLTTTPPALSTDAPTPRTTTSVTSDIAGTAFVNSSKRSTTATRATRTPRRQRRPAQQPPRAAHANALRPAHLHGATHACQA